MNVPFAYPESIAGLVSREAAVCDSTKFKQIHARMVECLQSSTILSLIAVGVLSAFLLLRLVRGKAE